MQAADDAEAGCGGELQQVEEQMAALDEELARQGGTQAPASMPPCCPTVDVASDCAAYSLLQCIVWCIFSRRSTPGLASCFKVTQVPALRCHNVLLPCYRIIAMKAKQKSNIPIAQAVFRAEEGQQAAGA